MGFVGVEFFDDFGFDVFVVVVWDVDDDFVVG